MTRFAAALLALATPLMFVLPAVPMPAQAASFDCSRATTAFERAICDDAGLSAKDEVLAVAYATAIGGLTAEAGAAMRSGQREWLAYVERACTPDGEPLKVPYDADGVACLSGEFDQRIAGLEASRMLGGHRFYLVERFLALPRQGEEDWNQVATKRFSAVHLDGFDAVAQAFNGFVAAQSAPMLDDFSPPDPQTPEGQDAYSINVDNSIVADRVSTRLVSLRVTNSWYGHGAAHPNYAITALHFRFDEQRALVGRDIFRDGYAPPFAEQVLTELRSQFPGDGLWDEAGAAVDAAVADPARWSFSDDGVSVHFQPYEVTAYAAGAPSVLVRWSELSDWLTDDAEALVLY